MTDQHLLGLRYIVAVLAPNFHDTAVPVVPKVVASSEVGDVLEVKTIRTHESIRVHIGRNGELRVKSVWGVVRWHL